MTNNAREETKEEEVLDQPVPVEEQAEEPAGVGEGQPSSAPYQELLPEIPFQRTYLGMNGGCGQPQFLCGSRDATLARHGPEVQQVVVVEPFHRRPQIRFYRTLANTFPICGYIDRLLASTA